MIKELEHKWFFGIMAAFAAVNGFLMLQDIYWFPLLPVALLVGSLAVLSLDKLLLIIVFFTPLSINLENLDLGLGIILPTEPLIFGAMILFVFKLWYEGKYDRKILRHPISIIIILHLIWMAFTVITSEMMAVSLKFLLVRLWFVITFYFIATIMFRYLPNVHRFLWLYIVSMTVVIIYTVVHHASFNFSEQPAHWVMQPFFKDHTSYGAVLAMFFPVVLSFVFSKKLAFNLRLLTWFLVAIFITGLILSYTRAAWISLAGVFALFLVLKFRVRLSILISGFLVMAGFLFFFMDDIMMNLEKNRQDSSGDIAEHVQSITNIASDASNLERINRWSCAIRMFEERPVFGWGPGTYMFQYAPFQHSSQLTIISTNFGDGGNAHSEYLGPLAESGLPGGLFFLLIVAVVSYRAIRLYMQLEDKELKRLVLAAFLGLVTYFIHGLLNNFLDLDKASVPFWGFIAIITAVDIYHRGDDHRMAKKEISDN